MKRSYLLSVLAAALAGTVAGVALLHRVASPEVTAYADSARDDAPGQVKNAGPSAVGAWFGIARPCPAVGDDVGHAALCQQICGACPAAVGALPPEVPMMPSILADGNVVVNDAGSIPVFHTTAQGQWAADPTDPIQLPGRVRYQASFVWLQGSGGTNAQFIGVARPRFVTFFDPKDPDKMFGYIQPHFFPIVNPGTGLVNVLPSVVAGPFETNHQTAIPFLGPLPKGCSLAQGCLGTYHFTIHRIKPNVPN